MPVAKPNRPQQPPRNPMRLFMLERRRKNMTVEQPETEPTPKSSAKAPSASAWRGLLLAALLAVIVLGCVLFLGLRSRARANTALQQETLANSIPTVAVIRPKATSGAEEVVFPGNMQAFIDTPIWARASGYLKIWYVDIGARVKQGQSLAEIQAPEVDQQVQQARANLATRD